MLVGLENQPPNPPKAETFLRRNSNGVFQDPDLWLGVKRCLTLRNSAFNNKFAPSSCSPNQAWSGEGCLPVAFQFPRHLGTAAGSDAKFIRVQGSPYLLLVLCVPVPRPCLSQPSAKKTGRVSKAYHHRPRCFFSARYFRPCRFSSAPSKSAFWMLMARL